MQLSQDRALDAILVPIGRINSEKHETKVGKVRCSPVNIVGQDSTNSVYGTISSLLCSIQCIIDIQGVPENMRHNDFFTSYMRTYKNTMPRLKVLLKFN